MTRATTTGRLRERLRVGEPLAGTVLSVADPALAELVAGPFDFVWIDLEHSALTTAEAQHLAIAASSADCAALARLPRGDSERLAALLDAGVDGIVAPRVENAAEAAAFVARTRHPPAGSRGFAHRRWSRWGTLAEPAEPIRMVQVESRAAVAAAAEIAGVDGVDALVVGTADLSLDLAVEPTLDGAELRAAIEHVQHAAHDARIASGIAAGGDPALLAAALAGRSQLVVYSADVRVYAEAVSAAAGTARNALTSITREVRS